jgi:hypothetical protein
MAIKKPTKSAWHTASLVPFVLPLACCFATNVAVTIGQKRDNISGNKSCWYQKEENPYHLEERK